MSALIDLIVLKWQGLSVDWNNLTEQSYKHSKFLEANINGNCCNNDKKILPDSIKKQVTLSIYQERYGELNGNVFNINFTNVL